MAHARELAEMLESEMERLAENLEFEEAAAVRNRCII